MRINGRILRPSTLAERRVLLTMGVTSLRVSRKFNPYAVARKIARLAKSETNDVAFLRQLVSQAKARLPGAPSPDGDVPWPTDPGPSVDVRAA
jgi:hypothetical protein